MPCEAPRAESAPAESPPAESAAEAAASDRSLVRLDLRSLAYGLPAVASPAPPRVRPSGGRVCLGLAWSALLAVGGGALCAWIQQQEFFLVSLVVLWLLGLPGGWIARRLTGAPSVLVAIGQAAALVGALLLMQAIWLRENIFPQPTWSSAWTSLPSYYRTNTLQAVSEAICGLCGAYVAGERLLRAPRRHA